MIRDISGELQLVTDEILAEMESQVDDIAHALKVQMSAMSKKLVRSSTTLKSKNEELHLENTRFARNSAVLNHALMFKEAEQRVAISAVLLSLSHVCEDLNISRDDPEKSIQKLAQKLANNKIGSTKSTSSLFREDSANMRHVISFILVISSEYLVQILREPLHRLLTTEEYQASAAESKSIHFIDSAFA